MSSTSQDRAAEPYSFLTPREARFVDAATARLIPEDELGPGAREAGIASFIDRQLSSSWGTHSRAYRQGPWREGTPQQGFQSPLTPQDIYRVAIREIDSHCQSAYGTEFHALAPEQQDLVLRALENGSIELASLRSAVFFELLLRNTIEGFFSDPIHGGNRNKVGWRLIGFPGVAAADYLEHMQKPNVPYRVEPVSILDIVRGDVSVDSNGYPTHVIPARIEKKNS